MLYLGRIPWKMTAERVTDQDAAIAQRAFDLAHFDALYRVVHERDSFDPHAAYWAIHTDEFLAEVYERVDKEHRARQALQEKP
jgi:hypothetical protein